MEREASLRKPETGKRCEKGGPLNPLVTQTLKLTVAEGHPTPGGEGTEEFCGQRCLCSLDAEIDV